MITEPLNASDQALMKSHLPAPARLLHPLLIDRPSAKLEAGVPLRAIVSRNVRRRYGDAMWVNSSTR